jgi:hypothetical protein
MRRLVSWFREESGSLYLNARCSDSATGDNASRTEPNKHAYSARLQENRTLSV